jgi:hypothetical protein
VRAARGDGLDLRQPFALGQVIRLLDAGGPPDADGTQLVVLDQSLDLAL